VKFRYFTEIIHDLPPATLTRLGPTTLWYCFPMIRKHKLDQ